MPFGARILIVIGKETEQRVPILVIGKFLSRRFSELHELNAKGT
jgi:hypothetical protein